MHQHPFCVASGNYSQSPLSRQVQILSRFVGSLARPPASRRRAVVSHQRIARLFALAVSFGLLLCSGVASSLPGETVPGVHVGAYLTGRGG